MKVLNDYLVERIRNRENAEKEWVRQKNLSKQPDNMYNNNNNYQKKNYNPRNDDQEQTPFPEWIMDDVNWRGTVCKGMKYINLKLDELLEKADLLLKIKKNDTGRTNGNSYKNPQDNPPF